MLRSGARDEDIKLAVGKIGLSLRAECADEGRLSLVYGDEVRAGVVGGVFWKHTLGVVGIWVLRR